jgi:hypothetical protein
MSFDPDQKPEDVRPAAPEEERAAEIDHEEEPQAAEPPLDAPAGDSGRPFPRQAVLTAALVGLIAFGVYLRTLAVSIVWGDSPELIAAAAQAGVPHPTGYPLYMMLGHAFIRLFPLGSVAYRMNLLSAIFAALAVALIYLIMLRLTRSRAASFAATLTFAFTQIFWAQAVIAEVYALHLLWSAAVLLGVLAWDATGSRRWLLAAAVLYGFSFSHHLMSALLAPALLLFAFTSRHRGQFFRELRWTVPLFLLPLAVYVYLPLAARRDPMMNWGDPGTWENFLAHVTGRQYHLAMFGMKRAQIWKHFSDYTGIGLTGGSGQLVLQFTAGFLPLALLGLWHLARRHRRLLALTLLIYFTHVVYALNYYIYDVEVYYLPSHLMVAVWIACGLRQLGVWLGLLWRRIALAPRKRPALNRVLGTALLVMPLTLLSTNWSTNDHSEDWTALMYARAALASLKPNTILLTGGDNYFFPLLYTRYVENRRPDVMILSYYDLLRPERTRLTTRLAPAGLKVRIPPCWLHGHPNVKDHNCLLKQVVQDNVGRRPVYVLGPPETLKLPWLAQVIAPYYRVPTSNIPHLELQRQSPRLAVVDPRPQRKQRATFGLRRPDGTVGNDLELLGYDVKPLRKGNVPWLRVSYYWRVNDQATARPAKVWVLFTDVNGDYRKKKDGTPEFHNIHPLAYGAGLGSKDLPRTLRESFDLYVPPQQWNQRLHMRIAVAVGEKFLPSGGAPSHWVEMGEIPPAPAVEHELLRVAAAGK